LKNEIKQELLKFNTIRRITQFLSFLLFTTVVFNLSALPFLLPVLWTWGIEPNTVGDAFTALQLMLSGWTGDVVVFPWLAIATFLTIGILLGKSLCGWICPFGFIQELVGFIKRRKMNMSQRTHESMIYVKYAVLGITLFVSLTVATSKPMGTSSRYENALGIFAKAPFTALSPAETLFATLPQMILNFRQAVVEIPFLEVVSGISALPPLFWIQFFILIGVLVFSAYVPRSWCKYFCPHGAIMAIMNKVSFLGLRRDLVKCAKAECRICVEVCPMNIDILDLPWEKFSDPECVYCMKCADACPTKAIRLKYP